MAAWKLPLTLTLLLLFYNLLSAAQPHNGGSATIDLAGKNQPLTLSCPWDFYYGRFLSAEELKTARPDARLPVPGSWRGKPLNGHKLSGFGYSTYRLSVTNCTPSQKYSLDIKEIGSAYNLFIDNRLTASMGVPGTNAANTTGIIIPQAVTFTPGSDNFQIILHIANYQDKNGGIWRAITLGPEKAIQYRKNISTILQLILIGILLLGGFYQMVLFILNRDDRSFLFFSLFCISVAVRTLIQGERFFSQLYPDVSLEFITRVDYLSTYSALPFWMLYLRHFFKGLIPAWLTRGVVAATALFAAFIITTPARVYTFGNLAFNWLVISCALYSMAVVIQALVQKRKNALSFLIAYAFIMIAVVNDSLQGIFIFNTEFFLHQGLFVFLIVQNIELNMVYTEMLKNRNRLPAMHPGMIRAFSAAHGLSKREHEIVTSLIDGKTYEAISTELFISLSTTKKHINSIYRKARVKNKLELARVIQQA